MLSGSLLLLSVFWLVQLSIDVLNTVCDKVIHSTCVCSMLGHYWHPLISQQSWNMVAILGLSTWSFACFHGLGMSFARFDPIMQNVFIGLSHDELVNWFIG